MSTRAAPGIGDEFRTAASLDGGLLRGDVDDAEVIVFLDQSVRLGDDAPRMDRNRVKVELEKIDGRWLLAGIKAL